MMNHSLHPRLARNQTDRPTRTSTGFTLIELLVVIAIIAILAAILFPVFAQAREKARQTVCLSNQKQIGTAMMMYVQDYDETYPMTQYTAVATPGYASALDHARRNNWRVQISPYLKSNEVFVCPSNPDNRLSVNGNNAGFQFRISYQGNRWGVISSPTSVVSMASLLEPSDLIVVVEVWDGRANGGTAAYDGDLNYDSPTHRNSHFVHPSLISNYLFADGHAKGMRPSQTIKDGLRRMWDRRDTTSTANANLRALIAAAEQRLKS